MQNIVVTIMEDHTANSTIFGIISIVPHMHNYIIEIRMLSHTAISQLQQHTQYAI